jgi:hypothetical protein
MKWRSVAGALLSVAFVSFAAPSHAALLSCPAGFTANGSAKVNDGGGAPVLTAASGCQYLDPPNASTVANESNVNAAGFFSTTNWRQVGAKIDLASGAGQTGTWSIASANFAAFDYMIVFKDGSGTNLIGFLLNELFSSGGWSSPFENPPFVQLKENQVKDVSHYTLFSRDGERQVSEPGVLVLFGLGLLMVGFLRRSQLGLGWVRRRTPMA